MVGEDPCDSTSLAFPEPVGLPSATDLRGHAPRRARGAVRRGHRARRARHVPGDARARQGPRRRDRRHHAPARPARARRLLPDRAGRGVGQPRPLRRRPLRPTASPPTTCSRCTCARAPRASAPRSSAASCSAPTRCPRATTTPTTAARRRCARRSPRTSTPPGRRATSWSRRPARARPSSSAPRPTTRGRCTSTTTARCRSRSPACPPSRSPTGSSEGLPTGFQIAGPAFSENRILDAAHALEQSDRLRRLEGAGGMSTGYEPVIGLEIHVQLSTQDEDVLLLRAVVRRGAQHAHLPGLPRPPRRAAGAQRAGGRVRAADGPGVRLRDRAAVDLPPQELLLSRQPEGVPDLPVRHPAVPGRSGGGGAAAPHPPGGGRREAHPPRRVGPHPRLVGERRRLQPRRHAAVPRSSPSPTSARPSRRASG